jgi:hypothetical protein
MTPHLKFKIPLALLAILLVNGALTAYGIMWGLPYRWSTDEQVAASLRLLGSGSIFAVTDAVHPQLYNFFLGALFAPYLVWLKYFSGVEFDAVQRAASVSWITLADQFPSVASALYLIARGSSLVLGLLSIVLVYRIGRLLYSSQAGLIGAAALAVSFGFVDTHHLAKHTALVVFLVLLVCYLALRAYQDRRIALLMWASLVSGLAFAAKLDGIIAALFVAASFYYGWVKPAWSGTGKIGQAGSVAGWAIGLPLCCFLGIAIGSPGLIANLPVYLGGRETDIGFFYGGWPPLSWQGLVLVLGKIRDNFVHVLVAFGVPLGLLAWGGLVWFLGTLRRHIPSRIVMWMVGAYSLIVVGYYTQYAGGSTKLMIHLLPLLSVMVGGALSQMRLSRKALVGALGLSLVWAAAMTLQADRVYAQSDTRYLTTRWIEESIPQTATIEVLQEGDVLFSSSLLRQYPVVYMGRHSQSYSESFYKPELDDEDRAYIERLDREGSVADYVIIGYWGDGFLSPPERGTFFWRLINGQESQYELVRVFAPRGSRLLTPWPEHASPVVQIFRQKSG